MEEEIEVVPSEETSVEETPSEQPQEEVVAEEPQPIAETYELPDGRKVDGQTLAKEWKENFLPEFTRKSQTLSEIERANLKTNPTPEKPYEDPNWQPANWKEAISLAKQETLQELTAKDEARKEQDKALENTVATQLTELKGTDPALNESALFLHATKYGFKDLKLAHQNMKDMSEMVKKVQTETAKNIAKRNDPVSITPGATGAKPNPSQFSNAREYLRSLTT